VVARRSNVDEATVAATHNSSAPGPKPVVSYPPGGAEGVGQGGITLFEATYPS
jgi:hypothetical protein